MRLGIARTAWTILLALTCIVASAEEQYFPKHSLDLRRSEFKSQWYAAQLKALQEPSLFSLTKTHSAEAYRFLWLRAFSPAIAIRVDVMADGSGALLTKIGTKGYHPGSLGQSDAQVLSKEKTQQFVLRIAKLDFWIAPNPVNDQEGTDGSQWIIEGVKKGRYHIVDRWSPTTGAIRELGLMLALDLAKMDIPKSEIY